MITSSEVDPLYNSQAPDLDWVGEVLPHVYDRCVAIAKERPDMALADIVDQARREFDTLHPFQTLADMPFTTE